VRYYIYGFSPRSRQKRNCKQSSGMWDPVDIGCSEYSFSSYR